MNKEEWIDGVLNSTKGLQKAEAPFFLQAKIMNRIGNGANRMTEKPSLQWAFALIAAVLVGINVFAILPKGQDMKTALRKNAGGGLDNSTVYTY